MSESIRRKNSTKQLLENLIRVTAQRSQEDAEEVERERRRRSREKEKGEGSPYWLEPQQHEDLADDIELNEELQPSGCSVLEEDEGFSDWSHRLVNWNEQEVPEECRTRVMRPSMLLWKPEPGEENQQEVEDEVEQVCPSESQEASPKTPGQSSNRNVVGASYSQKAFLTQGINSLQYATGQPTEGMSYLVAGAMRSRGGAWTVEEQKEHQEEEEEVEEDVRAALQTPWTSAETRQSPRDEDQEEEELNLTREEKQAEDSKQLDEVSAESRRTEEVNRSTGFDCSRGEESFTCYGPMSPTFKKLLIQFYPDEVNNRVPADEKCTIVERRESLRKSTNNIKKTLLPVAVSKIDKKLEQYTHALEISSKESRPGIQVMTDLTVTTEPVSSKKNLFEGGEAWNQNAVSVTPSKDADGLKVGVADLINQWVRGSENGSRCSSPFKQTDSTGGKRYKFVVTGHGKYEKVSINDSCEDTNCQSAQHFYEDL